MHSSSAPYAPYAVVDEYEFWRSRIERATNENNGIISSQREEISRLQARCQELGLQLSLTRAAVCQDVFAFCETMSLTTMPVDRAAPSTVTDIGERLVAPRQSALRGPTAGQALNDVMRFLHEYSAGLVAAPERPQKRERRTMEAEQPVGRPPGVSVEAQTVAAVTCNASMQTMIEGSATQRPPQSVAMGVAASSGGHIESVVFVDNGAAAAAPSLVTPASQRPSTPPPQPEHQQPTTPVTVAKSPRMIHRAPSSRLFAAVLQQQKRGREPVVEGNGLTAQDVLEINDPKVLRPALRIAEAAATTPALAAPESTPVVVSSD